MADREPHVVNPLDSRMLVVRWRTVAEPCGLLGAAEPSSDRGIRPQVIGPVPCSEKPQVGHGYRNLTWDS